MKTLKETGEQEIMQALKTDSKDPWIAFFYTPLCGTCKLAEKMLSITLEALSFSGNTYKCNVNFTPALAEKWEIKSVPCLIVVSGRRVTETIYAFHSVDHLYRVLSRYNRFGKE